jgi:transcriptional regulator GlxA family with amidase domain
VRTPLQGREGNGRRIVERMSTLSDKPAFTVAEVAALTGFSRQTVTRMFENEKGVLIVRRSETMHKRSYRSIRIPRAVYGRVIARLTVK